MKSFEYKVIPAPTKGLKAPGVKGPEARFANALEHSINELAADGWDYLRSDILPSEERQGLTSSQTVYRSVLVFHRAVTEAVTEEDTIEDEKPANTFADDPVKEDGPVTQADRQDNDEITEESVSSGEDEKENS